MFDTSTYCFVFEHKVQRTKLSGFLMNSVLTINIAYILTKVQPK